MDYNLGVIGLGHWFNRLNIGIQKVGGLSLRKAAGTKPFEQKTELLSSFSISKDNYYVADANGHLPEGFFDGMDVIHISDPNRLHADQTRDSLLHGKYVITEKSLATNKKEFNGMVSFLKKNGHENKVYLHLHYIHKQPTLILKDMLPGLVKRYGKIKGIRATFFESENEEDARRGWLFAPENGGIFMDWIHPFEILYHATGSNFGNIRELSPYAVNPSYDNTNPTGVNAVISLKGKYYAGGAKADISVAKGVTKEHYNKSIKLVFESGTYAVLSYVNSGIEFGSDERGKLEIGKSNGTQNKVLMSVSLSGPNPSEIFVEEILGLCNGVNLGLTIDEISRIFKPQWEYQKIMKSKQLITDGSAIRQFLDSGVSGMRCNSSKDN